MKTLYEMGLEKRYSVVNANNSEVIGEAETQSLLGLLISGCKLRGIKYFVVDNKNQKKVSQ